MSLHALKQNGRYYAPQSFDVWTKSVSFEEGARIFIERPDIKRQKGNPQFQSRDAHSAQQGTPDAFSAEFGCDTNVMNVDHLKGECVGRL
jgi:hypothetical protein